MKIAYMILSLICVEPFINNSDNITHINQEAPYRVLKIDSIESVFLVYLQRNDSVFKVVSPDTITNACQKISVDKEYDFDLKSWFLREEFHVKMRVSGVRFNGVMVSVEREGIVSDLFTTKNLNGLCYSPPVQACSAGEIRK